MAIGQSQVCLVGRDPRCTLPAAARRGVMVTLLRAVALPSCASEAASIRARSTPSASPLARATGSRDATGQLYGDPQSACRPSLSTDQTGDRKVDSGRAADPWEEQVQGVLDVRRTDAIVVELTDTSLSDQDKKDVLNDVAWPGSREPTRTCGGLQASCAPPAIRLMLKRAQDPLHLIDLR